MERFSKIISDIFLWIMNIGLLIIGVLLSFGLIMEAKEIYHEGVKFLAEQGNYQHFVEGILVFFLYFEFVALIVKNSGKCLKEMREFIGNDKIVRNKPILSLRNLFRKKD